MENLLMCRICLATEVRLCSIASHLRDMYERITAMTFIREDRRPLVACYICHARLQSCYRLRTSSLQSEELFTNMMSTGVFKPQDVLSTNSLSVVSLLHISVGHMLQEGTECHVKEEPPEITCDPELEQQYTEDMTKGEQNAQLHDDNQCSRVEIPLNIIKREPDDFETDAEAIKLEKEDSFLIENDLNAPGPSSQLADNTYPKIVKVALQKMDVNYTRTGARGSKKDKAPAVKDIEDATTHKIKIEIEEFEETEDITIEEHDIATKYTSVENLETCDDLDIKLNKYDANNTSLENDVSSIPLNKNEKFSCDTCNKCFYDNRNLKTHIRTHTGEKPYQCNVCKIRFTRKSSLKTHSRIHIGEKPYQCNICNKCFVQRNVLLRHMRIHTGDKPFQCNVCKIRFNLKHNLKSHILIHSGKKPHECDLCKKCFTRKDHLQSHLRTHTGQKPNKCNICQKCFNAKSALNRHIHSHTGNKTC